MQIGQAQVKPSMTRSNPATLVRELRLFSWLSARPQQCRLLGPDGMIAIERLTCCGVE